MPQFDVTMAGDAKLAPKLKFLANWAEMESNDLRRR